MTVVEDQADGMSHVDVMAVDPFGLAPEWISSIGGLGGNETGPDAAYAFHTSYAHYDEGEIVLTLTFTNLVATRGVLVLRINAYPDQVGSVAYQIILDEVLLRGVMADDGRAWIRFTPRPATRYALLGHVYGETDARADALTVTARHAVAIDSDAERKIAERRTLFSDPGVRRVAKLLSNHRSTLRDPVSQLCTESQFDEPLYAEWTARMGVAPERDPEQWEQVYTLQALRRYGMLEAGARGLGFGARDRPIVALLADIGCKITVTDRSAAAGDERVRGEKAALLDGLRRPLICDDALFDQRVTARLIAADDLPADLSGFDFLWSSSAHADRGSIAAGISFVVASILSLKPGGVAVFTGDLALPVGQAGTSGGDMFRRSDLERMTLILIGAGHEVAQLNFEGGHGDAVGVAPVATITSFGMIVRRGLRER